MIWIQTYGGRIVDLLTPNPETIDIEDIAHALARICRYTGHTAGHYSVAQHSVLVSRHLPPELAFDGLMHDAAEAYVHDVSAPLKSAMREVEGRETSYDIITHRVDAAISAKFGLTSPIPEAVRIADLRMLATEFDDLGFLAIASRPWHIPHQRFDDHIDGYWPFDAARDIFLNRFHQMFGAKGGDKI